MKKQFKINIETGGNFDSEDFGLNVEDFGNFEDITNEKVHTVEEINGYV